MNRGFTILMAVIVTTVLLTVSMGIISIAVKQAYLATASRDSQRAFYAADSGLECALYWDLKHPSGVSAFAGPAMGRSAATSINCNNQPFTVGGSATNETRISIDYNDIACTRAEVYVIKRPLVTPRTIIRVFGYSSCSNQDPRRVQRTVSAQY